MQPPTFPGRILLLVVHLFLTLHAFGGDWTLVAPEPATALLTGTRTSSAISLSWTPGTGSRRIVVLRPATGATTIAPAAGTDYVVSTSGSYTGPGNASTGTANVVVYNGSGSSVTITGLNAAATYIAVVYEYNGSAGNTEYSTGLVSGTLATLAANPIAQVASGSVTFGGVQGSTSVKIDYPAATAAAIGANGYLLLYKEGSGLTLAAGDLPTDGTAYTTGSTIGGATVGALINSSSQASSTVTGLTGTKHYTFFLVPYAGSATNTTYNYNTAGAIASRYVPSFSGGVGSAGGETAGISSLLNTVSISDATQGVQVWRFTISEGADDDALPTIIKSLTINTPASNQFSFSTGIQSAALFVGSTPVAATLTIPAGSDQLQFANIGNVTVPDNGSITLSLRLSVKANVNGGASTGSNNKDGARFVFQLSNANISADVASSSSQLSAFPAVTSAPGGMNLYEVVGTVMQFAQLPPASADPYVALTPAVAAEVVDAGGNRDVDYAAPVVLSSGLGVDGVVNAVPASGLATFTGLYFTGNGSGVLQAAGGGYRISSPVTVNAAGIAGVYTFNAAGTCSGTAYAPSAVADHLAFSNLSLTGISCNSNGNGPGATTAATILSTNTTWPAAPDAGKYIEFGVSAASGYGIHATALAFETLRTAAGATNVTLRSSLDGYSSDLGAATVGATQAAVTLPLGAAFAGITGTVSFRLYPWGGTSGNFRIDNLALRGSLLYSQAVAEYRSVQSGSHDDAATWEYYSGTAWAPATQAPGAANPRLIQSGHTVSLGADVSITPGVSFEVNGTLDAGTQVISGSGVVLLNGALRTAHSSGLSGTLPAATITIGNTGTICYTGSSQVITARNYVHLDLSAATAPQFPAGNIGISGVLHPGACSIIDNSTVIFNGSSPQRVPAISYEGLQVDNIGGLQLAGPVSAGTLSLGSGTLALGAYTLTAGAISGGSAASFIVTDGSGVLKRSALNGTQQFPVGPDAATYTPVSISHSDGIDWSVRVQAGFSGVPAMNSSLALPLVWHLLPAQSPTTSAATLAFSFPDALWPSPALVNAYHYSNGWFAADNGTGLGAPLAGGMRTVTLPGQTRFSPFAIASPATPLPVRLLYFRGRSTEAGGLLEWATATESNNAGFTVERSRNGQDFETLVTLPSAAPGGNNATRLDYQYTDATLPEAGAWYRLRQTGRDGHSSTSSVLQLRKVIAADLQLVQSGSMLRLHIRAAKRCTARMVLYGVDGSVLCRKEFTLTPGSSWYEVPAPAVPGLYFLGVELPGETQRLSFTRR